MSKYYNIKVRYDETNEKGDRKKVTKSYLVDALSFTEAEARIIKEIKPSISGDMEVTNITPAHIAEVVCDKSAEADKWYKCKVQFITVSETTNAEKRTNTYMLVQAADSGKAVANLHAHMKGTMAYYELASITDTLILDVYLYGKD